MSERRQPHWFERALFLRESLPADAGRRQQGGKPNKPWTHPHYSPPVRIKD
jgi:hypothetical protein